jgi:FKBP-type peptidyl-prolyl cis-trans isomerase
MPRALTMRTIIISAVTVLATAGVTLSQDEKKKEEPAAAAPATAADPAAAAPAAAEKAPAPEANPQNTGYAIGTFFGRQIKQAGFKVDAAEVLKGFTDATEGKKLRFSEEQIQQIMQAAQQESMKGREGAGADNKKAGADFLAKNGKEEGVVTTKSGLQYKVLKAAEGAKPTAENTVKVHYHGTLLDGTVFDSSVDRGEPISFPLNGVIKGWTEGVQLMNVGSKFKFFIPSDLAYGDRGAGGDIGPGATLIFEVELIAIEK